MVVQSRINLELLAKDVMVDSGLEPDFPQAVDKELEQMTKAAPFANAAIDLRKLLFCSIDNDDSKDLDQLTYAEKQANGNIILWVAVADVDALVIKNSAIDQHARKNTTSVYTPAKIFPMLPLKLSTDLTSLNENVDRSAMVIKMTIDIRGSIIESSIFQASVHNHAKLTYHKVGAWLAEEGEAPEKVTAKQGLEETLRIQHEAAQRIRINRQKLGALTLESAEPEAKITENATVVLQLAEHNYAEQLIENFMIAANSTIALSLKKEKIASLRRVVKTPKNWDRIVEIARNLGETLPLDPDPKALDAFLVARKKEAPLMFPDLSLSVIKLLGSGEYIVELPGGAPVGHFGLALSEYTHSTAPNRRYPDLITQRLYKAHLAGQKSPYALEELQELAAHCTRQEDNAKKVERHLTKSAAALLLSSKIGKTFDGIVTGASDKGTWVRIFNPPVEGKVVKGFEKLNVGDPIEVRLKSVDVSRGFIDFIAL